MTTPRRPIPALIALNAALLVVLALVVLTPSTAARQDAQATASARPRGTYTMVGGRITGSPESAIYIVDAVNQELIATKWDRSRKALRALGYQSLVGARRPAEAAPSDPGR